MTRCRKCGLTKPPEDFYVSRPQVCKECVRAEVKANRAARAEYYQAYDRARTDIPKRVAARRRVADERRADPKKKAIDEQRGRDWIARNRLKRRAHIRAGNAIRDGVLIAPEACERCGEPAALHAHHEDYEQPLVVVWLCPTCHGLRHREINAARRAAAE